jgi:hypothetical protein
VTATGIAGPPATASASVTVPKPAPVATLQTVPGVPKLVTTKLVDSGGRVKLKLRCPAGTSGCAGKLQLTFAVRRSTKKTTTLRLRSGSYILAAGRFKTLTLKLSGRVAGLLASHDRRLTAKLTLSPLGAKARTLKVTITPAPKKKHTR